MSSKRIQNQKRKGRGSWLLALVTPCTSEGLCCSHSQRSSRFWVCFSSYISMVFPSETAPNRIEIGGYLLKGEVRKSYPSIRIETVRKTTNRGPWWTPWTICGSLCCKLYHTCHEPRHHDPWQPPQTAHAPFGLKNPQHRECLVIMKEYDNEETHLTITFIQLLWNSI